LPLCPNSSNIASPLRSLRDLGPCCGFPFGRETGKIDSELCSFCLPSLPFCFPGRLSMSMPCKLWACVVLFSLGSFSVVLPVKNCCSHGDSPYSISCTAAKDSVVNPGTFILTSSFSIGSEWRLAFRAPRYSRSCGEFYSSHSSTNYSTLNTRLYSFTERVSLSLFRGHSLTLFRFLGPSLASTLKFKPFCHSLLYG